MNYITLFIMTLIGLAMLCICVHSHAKPQLRVGAKAPMFTLQNEHGNTISLQQFHGKKVALMFYPSINTPHCSKEVCTVQNTMQQLVQHNIIVLGISYNDPQTNKKFAEKNHIVFPLLYDKDKKVSKAYGVQGWFFPSRTTFLINEQGNVVGIIDNVYIANHANQIINGFK